MPQTPLGSDLPRKEDARLVSGRGCYVADLRLEGMVHGAVVRSPHAHARIRGIDAAGAMAMPGVLLVLSAQDARIAALGPIPWELRPPAHAAGAEVDARLETGLQPILARDVARYLGEPVAFVVADTPHAAADAAERVVVDYETLPAVTSPDGAVRAAAPCLHAAFPGNVYFTFDKGDRAAADAAFAGAHHVAELELRNNRLAANPMEPRGCIAEFDPIGGRFTLHASTGKPHLLKRDIARGILGIDAERIRVLTQDVGGGFGAKNHVYPEHVLTMLAAERLARPVRWIATRAEMLLSDAHGRDQFVRAALALDARGRFVGLKVSIIANLGAYLSPRGVVPPILGGRALQGAYDIPAVHLDVRAVFSNSTPVGTYRGAGAPEVMYILERLVDCAARESGIDPAVIRRRNLIPLRAMPYKNAFGVSYDREDFVENFDAALALAEHKGFAERRRQSRRRGKLRGLGISYTLEAVGLGISEEATVSVGADGRAEVLIGTMSNGQGHETTYAQIAAVDLGLPPDAIDVVQGDTDRIRSGNGTGASRSITVGGAALRLACRDLVEAGRALAAHLLQAAPERVALAGGLFRVEGSVAAMNWSELASAARDPQIVAAAGGAVLSITRRFDPPNYTFPSGCHVCEVEIDPATGVAAVVGYAMVHDVGVAINPQIVAGQLVGGVVQGIGQALCEAVVYDGDGQLLSGSFQDYAMPRAHDAPPFRLVIKQVPASINVLGAKGCGEAGATAAPPAVINAVVDALADFGVRHVEMPATAARIWRAIETGRAAGRGPAWLSKGSARRTVIKDHKRSAP
jgi:carbon-monoxide dehydrogenase large subunit